MKKTDAPNEEEIEKQAIVKEILSNPKTARTALEVVKISEEKKLSTVEKVLLVMGIAFREAGDLNKAEYYFHKLSSINKDNKLLYDFSGTLVLEAAKKAPSLRESAGYVAKGKLEEALLILDRAMEEYPNCLPIIYYKVGILEQLGNRPQELIDCLQMMLKINPSDAFLWTKLGGQYMHLNNFAEMLRCDETAIKIDKSYAEAWVGRGIALHGLGRPIEAKESFQRAIEAGTKHDPAILLGSKSQKTSSTAQGDIKKTRLGGLMKRLFKR